MAVPSRQIGWSQEANLLHQIARQLDRLINILCCSPATTTTTTTTVEPPR